MLRWFRKPPRMNFSWTDTNVGMESTRLKALKRRRTDFGLCLLT